MLTKCKLFKGLKVRSNFKMTIILHASITSKINKLSTLKKYKFQIEILKRHWDRIKV
jgi:hypothetical protein